ncbi:response regulator [candidate division KSB1 bacterium]
MNKRTVLFADDDKDFRAFMREIIDELSKDINVELDVTEAKDGSEAINLYSESIKKNKPFDFVVTDYKMPLASGLELIKYIVKTKPVPIIVISAYSEPHPNEFVKEGAIIFISKPFTIEQIASAFSEAISLSLVENDIKRAREIIKELEKLTS